MRTTASSKRISARSSREDGDATKTRIIDAAGRLFAERGYAETTSKEICERAKTNITGVNYHFGSREGLYHIVLKAMHDYLISSANVIEIARSSLSPKQKLEKFLDTLFDTNLKSDSWQVRLWAREVVSPSALPMEDMADDSKFYIVRGFISEITGIPPGEPALEVCFLNVMAPFMVLLITGQKKHSPHGRIFMERPAKLATEVKEFIFAGLNHFAAKYAQKESSMPKTDLPT